MMEEYGGVIVGYDAIYMVVFLSYSILAFFFLLQNELSGDFYLSLCLFNLASQRE